MTYSRAQVFGYIILFVSNEVFQCLGRSDLELDLNRGRVYGRHPYLKLLNSPQSSSKIPCSGQAVIRLNFSGPYKRAKFELFYGSDPKLWTFLLADSPSAYGFGGDHKYTSNCASMQMFNKQLRVYSNVLPHYRYKSLNGQTLMDVVDQVVRSGTNMSVEVGDEMLAWKTKQQNWTLGDNREKDKIRSPFLFTLSGQQTEFGPREYYLYAAFNRVPLGRFHNGSGLCRVRITFKRKQDNGVCAKVKHTCHRNAVCRKINSYRHKCVCKPGFVGDGIKSCKDLDECQINKGNCHQRCHNLQGSYYCSCRHGFTLLPNGRDCTGKRSGSSVVQRIRLKFHVGQCNFGRRKAKERIQFLKLLKRKLLSLEICNFPCMIKELPLKCRNRRGIKTLLANFDLELDQSIISTSRFCNESCLRCQVEKRLQKFIVELRNLASSEKFSVPLRGQVYTMNGKSLKVPRVRSVCPQGRRRKNKRLAGCMPGMYFDIFLQRCVNCSRGSYQPNRSENFCFRCPDNMTTTYSGARHLVQCQKTFCGGNLTSVSGLGIITSPNYPDAYPRNLECTWTLSPRRGRNLLLLIPSISLPTSLDCSDYLTMRESDSPYSVVTYYACESFDQPVSFVSRSKNLYIKFRSRSNGMAEGFKIFYVTFEERYRDLVKHIVEDGELYANESNRRLLQDEKLVLQILEVIVKPSRLLEYYPNASRLDHKVPKAFRLFIEHKVQDYFDLRPYRKKRST